eukprot:16227001-Heterocapsa_arctica.AAC.1
MWREPSRALTRAVRRMVRYLRRRTWTRRTASFCGASWASYGRDRLLLHEEWPGGRHAVGNPSCLVEGARLWVRLPFACQRS